MTAPMKRRIANGILIPVL
uniref:Uncharacterized protein n=1 Tax=Anguilla anguilla TaxID=7936 RepID=A0A0E9VCE6_ANGAN